MSRLRLSHTFLLLWSQGRIQEAMDMYYHRKTVKSKAMEDGIKWHKTWQEQIENEGQLSMGRTTFTFKDPVCEKKLVAPLNDEVEISCVYDCLDYGCIYEWKSGVMSALEYVQGYQLGIYFLVAELLDIPVERGILAHFNQYENEADIVVVWNTERERDKARNFIESLTPEIVSYFEQYQLPFEK